MTLLTPEQIAAAQKTNLETLFGLTTKAFEGVEKLVELNLQVVKSTLAESQENAHHMNEHKYGDGRHHDRRNVEDWFREIGPGLLSQIAPDRPSHRPRLRPEQARCDAAPDFP